MIRNIIIKIVMMLIPKKITNAIVSKHLSKFNQNIYNSNEGEDILLEKIFSGQTDGFYLDVGAHHPTRFSNTFKFYLKGWRGINIDANPGSMNAFNQLRKEDINVEFAVSDNEENITYYVFNEPALNTFDKGVADRRNKLPNCEIINKVNIQTHRLENILDKYIKENQKIDFMSIDVEGLDLNVLKSNNWEKYRPSIIMIEDINKLLEIDIDSEIGEFLKSKGYIMCSKLFYSCVFKENKFKL